MNIQYCGHKDVAQCTLSPDFPKSITVVYILSRHVLVTKYAWSYPQKYTLSRRFLRGRYNFTVMYDHVLESSSNQYLIISLTFGAWYYSEQSESLEIHMLEAGIKQSQGFQKSMRNLSLVRGRKGWLPTLLPPHHTLKLASTHPQQLGALGLGLGLERKVQELSGGLWGAPGPGEWQLQEEELGEGEGVVLLLLLPADLLSGLAGGTLKTPITERNALH